VRDLERLQLRHCHLARGFGIGNDKAEDAEDAQPRLVFGNEYAQLSFGIATLSVFSFVITTCVRWLGKLPPVSINPTRDGAFTPFKIDNVYIQMILGGILSVFSFVIATCAQDISQFENT